jgi:hypothetical protein
MMAVSNFLEGHYAVARRHAERMLCQSHSEADELALAAQTELCVILWAQGFPDQALDAARASMRGPTTVDHADALSLCRRLGRAGALMIWTENFAEAEHLAAMLLECSNRNALTYWQLWARCLRGALAPRDSETNTQLRTSLIQDPLCTPFYLDHAVTLNEGLLTPLGRGRAHSGLAGGSTPEILRAEAQQLLRANDQNGVAATALLKQSLNIARQQGGLSWELRTATSLARLWQKEGRIVDARELLADVYGRFTEGFETADLLKARALLDELRAVPVHDDNIAINNTDSGPRGPGRRHP